MLRERIVVLGSQVDDAVANPLAAQMLLPAEDPERDIHLSVDSPGGSVDADMAVHDPMRFRRLRHRRRWGRPAGAGGPG
nr:ATP-dependent Clp protease proteolytic subunit [Geodermatophilus sp. DF01_2]